ncbi:MAG: hypothetical protein ACAI44_24915 [Candidatus Sericytochromatia bacterium]
MQRYLIEHRLVDPYYVEYVLSTAKPDVVDHLIADTVRAFRQQGLQTAVVTESIPEGWLVSCIAIELEQLIVNSEQ